MPTWRNVLDGAARCVLVEGDCVEVMGAMPAASVDAICADPPYGLGFLDCAWDRFAEGLPNAAAWRGRRADTSVAKGSDNDAPAGSRFPSGVYGGRNVFKRCRQCGRRAFSGTPCTCPTKDWELVAPGGAPVHALIFQRWCEEWMREALRVLKPGGHLIAFGGDRTHHRMFCAAEDAGFEIRDTLMWIFGQGFNKVGMIANRDGLSAAERAVVAGLGGSLKPAHEPILLARKPLSECTVAANVLAHGTGALNIDASRAGASGGGTNCTNRDAEGRCRGHANAGRSTSGETIHAPLPRGHDEPRGGDARGRWPSNPLLSHSQECVRVGTRRVRGSDAGTTHTSADGWGMPPERRNVRHADADGMEEVAAWQCAEGCAVAELDRQSGVLTSGRLEPHHACHDWGYGGGARAQATLRATSGDSGGASRFFYCAKAAGDSERWFYCRACKLAGPKSLAARHARCIMPDKEAGAGGERRPERAVVYHPT